MTVMELVKILMVPYLDVNGTVELCSVFSMTTIWTKLGLVFIMVLQANVNFNVKRHKPSS